MKARAGNSMLDFKTLISDIRELLNGSGLRPLPFINSWKSENRVSKSRFK